MQAAQASQIASLLRSQRDALLAAWLQEQAAALSTRSDLLGEAELRRQSAEFLDLLSRGIAVGGVDPEHAAFEPLRDMLADISRARALQGFTPSETAMFVFGFKPPLFAQLRQVMLDEPQQLADLTAALTVLLDRLGLLTTEAYQRSREEVIRRQQAELMELSTPVVQLWEGVLALPLIGTLDSARTQVVMESLLQKIVETGSSIAVIDITGVPTVDTLVAQHLIKTVAAARLMGAECIISGIRPQIAQTIVHLGVDLGPVTTKASLADAFQIALRKLGLGVVRTAAVVRA